MTEKFRLASFGENRITPAAKIN